MSELYKKLRESADFIAGRYKGRPDIAIVLGSGLGSLASEIEEPAFIPYADIPHFPVSTAPGHEGRLVCGKLCGADIICMQGRFHFYEGWSFQQAAYPVQAFAVMGVKKLFLTNAAGCVNTGWKQGDLMLIRDHIKLSADSPLRGENPEELRPSRFFDMGTAWSPRARVIARKAAEKLGIALREGVYIFFGGPQFETPAEIKMAALLGADAVGMSTVPEAIAAAHAGLETLGLSCLTNMAAGLLDQKLDEDEVLEEGKKAIPALSALAKEIISAWRQ